jgi:hypothetical protein
VGFLYLGYPDETRNLGKFQIMAKNVKNLDASYIWDFIYK